MEKRCKGILSVLFFQFSIMLTFSLPVTVVDKIKHHTAVVRYPSRYSR